ncbi:hypothetical protein LVJ85_12435 [Neisseria sp. Dent CA1/247]|uniref:hypothetical protein n=1 Tax=Neisseria sp. Dent CA1/247 TaxID=2912675 RepID=UPI001FD57D75|nr:hypothetical protein [Neisseria sp. Dent CA1/247]UOO76790.1 hypothetical protein LVJ85_12435 [Neisseria sp. Dent CA1/247]
MNKPMNGKAKVLIATIIILFLITIWPVPQVWRHYKLSINCDTNSSKRDESKSSVFEKIHKLVSVSEECKQAIKDIKENKYSITYYFKNDEDVQTELKEKLPAVFR